MRFPLVATVFLCLVCLQLKHSQTSDAQVFGKTIHDYWLDKPFQYKPSDPWMRGKIFQIHTGHYGRFYNCDKEECKRNSPYICWKTHYERDIPPRRGLLGGIREDLDGVMQRIRDGAGPCCPSNCQCADCQNVRSTPVQSCDCAHCSRASEPTEINVATSPPLPVQPQQVATNLEIQQPEEKVTVTGNRIPDELPPPRMGLVSGRTFGVHAKKIETATDVNQQQPARVARRKTAKEYLQGVLKR